jgi:hypothetical protein
VPRIWLALETVFEEALAVSVLDEPVEVLTRNKLLAAPPRRRTGVTGLTPCSDVGLYTLLIIV